MEVGIQSIVVSSLGITLEIEETHRIIKTFTNLLHLEVHSFINNLQFKGRIWILKMTNHSLTSRAYHILEKINRKRVLNSIKKSNKTIINSSINTISSTNNRNQINEPFIQQMQLLWF